MLTCRWAAPEEFAVAYGALWQQHKKGFATFFALDSYMARLVKGDFLVLRNRFRVTTLALLRSGEPILLATLFEPRPGWPGISFPASIGALVAAPSLQAEEAEFFWSWVKDRFAALDPVGPLNGHHYLGFGQPPAGALAEKVGFQTGAPHALQETLFGRFRGAVPYRRAYTLETELNQELVNRLKADLSEPPPGIRVRTFRPWAAKADFSLMNSLVNRCFTRHFDFAPLSDEENWDLFRLTVPLLRPSHLLFLEDRGRPVGFCLGMRDYNRLLKNDSDLANYSRILLGKRPRRGRLVHIGILPEYRGRKLIKQVRHRILLAFAREGMDVVENSYIDEANANSQGNVLSTGAKPLYEFHLHRLARS